MDKSSWPLTTKLYCYFFEFKSYKNINIHHSALNSKTLFIIRLIAFLVISTRYAVQFSELNSLFKIAQFLTELGFFISLLYFALVIQDYLLNQVKKRQTSSLLKNMISLIFEIGICIQIPVTALFWTILFEYDKPHSSISIIKEIGIHAFPLICYLLDLVFNLYQFPWRHLIPVTFIGICYLIVNITYSLEVKPIYQPLDWVSPMCYVWIGVCLFLVIGSFTLFNLIWEKYKKPFIELSKQQELNYQQFVNNQKTMNQLH